MNLKQLLNHIELIGESSLAMKLDGFLYLNDDTMIYMDFGGVTVVFRGKYNANKDRFDFTKKLTIAAETKADEKRLTKLKAMIG